MPLIELRQELVTIPNLITRRGVGAGKAGMVWAFVGCEMGVGTDATLDGGNGVDVAVEEAKEDVVVGCRGVVAEVARAEEGSEVGCDGDGGGEEGCGGGLGRFFGMGGFKGGIGHGGARVWRTIGVRVADRLDQVWRLCMGM